MTWLRGHFGSIAMALLLAVLTWTWLYSESIAPPKPLDFEFQPVIGPVGDIAEITFKLRKGTGELIGEKPNQKIRVHVSGPRGHVAPLRTGFFACRFFIPDDRFSKDEGEFTFQLNAEDFPIPTSATIEPKPELIVQYVKYKDVTVPLQVTPGDVDPETLSSTVGVERIEATPARVRLRVPANQLDKVGPSAGIKKINASGRTSTFETRGSVDVAGVKNVQQLDDVRLLVVLKESTSVWIVKDVKLHLAGPPAIVQRLKFKNEQNPLVWVSVVGNRLYEKDLTPEDLFVYARADHLRELEPGAHHNLQSFGGEVAAKFKSHVRIEGIMVEAKVENRQVEVTVLPPP